MIPENWEKPPPPFLEKPCRTCGIPPHFLPFYQLCQLFKILTYTQERPDSCRTCGICLYPWSPYYKSKNWAENQRPDSCHTCGIPMVPILQICTQIPPIQISSLGYQLCQLFKILTYTQVQDTGLWCRWKAYRQPYHNTH